MGRYVADTDQILGLVDRARSIGTHIEERIADIEREVADLNVDWDGEGADAHRSKHELLHREMKDMRDALTQLSVLAHDASDRYRANAEHNMRMWP